MGDLSPFHRLAAEYARAHRVILGVSVLRQRRERATHDLGRPPAIQGFRRRIPGEDIASPIERVNRERRALNDRLELLVGVPQGRLRAPALRRDGAEGQPRHRKHADVQQEHYGGTRQRLHRERSPATRRVADGEQRHDERGQ